MMADNKWNTGHNPEDGQNEWGFYADGTFKTLKDNGHGEWHIEMRDKLYLLMIWKSTSTHNWADFVFADNMNMEEKRI